MQKIVVDSVIVVLDWLLPMPKPRNNTKLSKQFEKKADRRRTSGLLRMAGRDLNRGAIGIEDVDLQDQTH